MKKILTITLLVLLTVGLFVSCNGNAVETVFDTSYKVQADGSWKMGNKVYEPSTKPYILVLPKTLNIEKDVQLADLQAGLMTLDEIRPSQTAVKIGNATVQLMHDNLGNEYYEYINKGDESQAQQIFMRTTDNDFTETILLKAPYDEFSHYGSLNVATVDDVAPESYYEYGRVRKVILSIGHFVAKTPSQIDVIIVKTNETSKVSVDVETTNVIGIIAPEGVAITKPASVVTAKPNEKKFLASDGNFYDDFADIPSAVEKIILLNNIDDALESDKSVTFDLSGNTVSGAITVQAGHTLTLTCSEGKGKVEQQPTVNGTLIIEGGNYKFDPSKYIDEDSYESKKVDGTDYYRVTKKASSGDSETQHKGICFTAEEEGAAVKLQKNGSPNDVKIVYSTDGINYQDYTFGEEISAPNIGDKVYFKAKDRNETFSKGGQDFYQFHILNLKKMSCEGNVM